MKRLVFATHNNNKVKEINLILPEGYQVQSLKEIGFLKEIEEPFSTIEENSLHKAKYIFEELGIDCFSEDTGLIIPALNGAPGVHSARYAGEPANDDRNIQKVLDNLKDTTERAAYFKTVITYKTKEFVKQFEGICEGHIGYEKIGENGFGYDPIFFPNGSAQTFAELSMEEKNAYSHRKKAMYAFLSFLENTNS